jgi:branched-chain amino acid transport system permease protein
MGRWIVFAIGLVVWAAVPALFDRHFVGLLVFAGLYVIAGLGVGLLLGQCGIVNLAQAAFYAIGAYATAYCTVQLGLPSIAGFLAGIVCSVSIAFLLGWPILRLTGYFLALATLALGIIAYSLFFEWDGITGGELGIGGIPKLAIGGFSFDTPERFYYLVWGVVFVCMLLVRNLVTSRTGLMMRAMRDAPEAAASLAIDMHWLRTKMFMICAALGSLGGSLLAHHINFVSVHSFSIERSIILLLIPVLGGITSLPGIVVGALFVTFVPEFLSRFGDFHQVLFGLALVAIVVIAPNGLVGIGTGLLDRWRKRAAVVAPSADGAR